jgi:hypothetical protein
MAVKKVSSGSQLVSALFTTLLAPVVASVVAAMIKEDLAVDRLELPRPSAQQTVVRFQAPTTPTVMLLPPVPADSRRATQDEYGPSR